MANETLDLARRFEPILLFHRSENYFPCDAKRYIERSALWKAERPFDQKDSWGGKGHAFNRKPLIRKNQIAASDAPGEIKSGNVFLGAREGSDFPFLKDNGEQHFFEVAGWKDSPDVTATSENRYAERDKLVDLQPGNFWYHAELYDTVRLRKLLVPDLGALFTELEGKNPALLCYYFFFPAHDESLPAPCDQKESGKEYASFAGEWACMAILLARESPAGKFFPNYIGLTGRFNAGTRQGLDAERRFGMTVIPWRKRKDIHEEVLPAVVGEHPVIYVSLGVHSLHLQPGPQIVTPYLPDSAPASCGEFDSPIELKEYLDAQPESEEDGSPAAAWAKIVGGLFFGGVPGLIGGAIATALEGLPLGPGYNGRATGSAPPDNPAVDTGPDPNDPTQLEPILVLPQALNLKTIEPFPHVEGPFHWQSNQDVTVDGRHYDFIVDRSKQVWWPSDDLKSGYRGRWGPLVVNDPLHRRSGMRFPEFWRMFFTGLAKNP
jgi:hypothetical protein